MFPADACCDVGVFMPSRALLAGIVNMRAWPNLHINADAILVLPAQCTMTAVNLTVNKWRLLAPFINQMLALQYVHIDRTQLSPSAASMLHNANSDAIESAHFASSTSPATMASGI